jgi:predicted TIM-barrel fold metal-dependent hydrolase
MPKANDSTSSKGTSDGRFIMVSSDGHATARMPDYRRYMAAKYHEEFDAFCKVYEVKGSRNNERPSMLTMFDPEVVDDWQTNVIEQGRLEGTWDVDVRFKEMARCGVSAEVIFPDFGLPFELYSPFKAITVGYRRTQEQIDVGNMAYNRWLHDFCAAAPERFVALAAVSFADVGAALAEIRWAKDAGFGGVVLPMFSEEYPVFHSRFDPVWDALEELEMPVNSHIAISAASESLPRIADSLPDASVAAPLFNSPLFFYCHYLFKQFIWGGVLQKHPDLQVVFTEQGSGWTVSELRSMDYTWEGSYTRRDVHNFLPHSPSEYFARQCHLGSSIFSREEMEARDEIGVHKMTIGVDFPHPEGSWGMGPGHFEYLRATVGAAYVPDGDARLILGENAIKLWGLNRRALSEVAAQIGPHAADILSPPKAEYFPRGDVHKPLAQAGR